MQNKIINIKGTKVTFDFQEQKYNIDTTDYNLIGQIQEDKEFKKWHEFFSKYTDYENGLLDEEGRKEYTSLLEKLVKEINDKKNEDTY